MIELRSQKDLRAAQRLSFCCLCGKEFQPDDESTREHIPSKGIFAAGDRNPPLVMRAHRTCNEEKASDDKLVAQLFSPNHGRVPTPRDLSLQIDPFQKRSGGMTAGFKNLPLKRIVYRWVKCFHAALYQEPLVDMGGNIFMPFQEGRVEDGKVKLEEVTICRVNFTAEFKRQLRAGRTDGVVCYNGRCVYRCTWLWLDGGEPICLFALRIYDWERLGDKAFGRRGCLGWYFCDIPEGASIKTDLEIAGTNVFELDPFGE